MDKYVLRYENTVFDIHDHDQDSDFSFDADADPSYYSELNEKNEEIAANDDLEEHDVSNSEKLIASNSKELTASNSNT